jgi:hypothetical protein
VELIEGVSADPDTETESEERPREARCVDLGCHGGTNGNIREVPHQVRQVEECDEIAEATAGDRVESRS